MSKDLALLDNISRCGRVVGSIGLLYILLEKRPSGVAEPGYMMLYG
jgi:hypothetical protein